MKIHKMKLFSGEKWLVWVGVVGFLLAGVCAVYMGLYGREVLPEGNVQSAFSFNAAIGIFIFSIAALLPLAGLSDRKRKRLRWSYFSLILISCSIETVQNFRGINPRYTEAGSVMDTVIGLFFGIISLLLVVLTVQLAIAFFRKGKPVCGPLLLLGIRYAFLSTMLALGAGMIMIVLQGRYLGASGNFIVLHGLGFHALQTLPFSGWFLERVPGHNGRALMHIGSAAWMIAVVAIGWQTVLGRTIFEWSLLPVLTSAAMLVWLVTAILSVWRFVKTQGTGHVQHTLVQE